MYRIMWHARNHAKEASGHDVAHVDSADVLVGICRYLEEEHEQTLAPKLQILLQNSEALLRRLEAAEKTLRALEGAAGFSGAPAAAAFGTYRRTVCPMTVDCEEDKQLFVADFFGAGLPRYATSVVVWREADAERIWNFLHAAFAAGQAAKAAELRQALGI